MRTSNVLRIHDRTLARHGLKALTRDIGEPRGDGEVQVRINGGLAYSASRLELHRRWSEVSFRLQEMRDNPECAREEYERLNDAAEQAIGLHHWKEAVDVGAATIVAAERQGHAEPAVSRNRGHAAAQPEIAQHVEDDACPGASQEFDFVERWPNTMRDAHARAEQAAGFHEFQQRAAEFDVLFTRENEL